MVVRSVAAEQDLDGLFRALADVTRRDIVARTLVSEESVSTLASRYAMSFAAVQKHVAVLERAGLVRKRAAGREQLVSADYTRLQRASELLKHFEHVWRHRMRQLDELLEEDPKGT
jgi:DNA-binding transcriptional ArsR family regulator